MPIVPSIPVTSIMQKTSILEKFDRINVIPIGDNPFIDIKLIPFSIVILDRYKVFNVLVKPMNARNGFNSLFIIHDSFIK
jgi:hypothetical protein